METGTKRNDGLLDAYDFEILVRTNKVLVGGMSFDVPQEKAPLKIMGIKKDCERKQGWISFGVAPDATNLETKDVGIVFRNVIQLSFYGSTSTGLYFIAMHISVHNAEKFLEHIGIKDVVNQQIRRLGLKAEAVSAYIFQLHDVGDGVAYWKNGKESILLDWSTFCKVLQDQVRQKRLLDVSNKQKPRGIQFLDRLTKNHLDGFLSRSGFTLSPDGREILTKLPMKVDPTMTVKAFTRSKLNKQYFLQKEFVTSLQSGDTGPEHPGNPNPQGIASNLVSPMVNASKGFQITPRAVQLNNTQKLKAKLATSMASARVRTPTPTPKASTPTPKPAAPATKPKTATPTNTPKARTSIAARKTETPIITPMAETLASKSATPMSNATPSASTSNEVSSATTTNDPLSTITPKITPGKRIPKRKRPTHVEEMVLDDDNESPMKKGPNDINGIGSTGDSLLTYPSKGLDKISINYHDMRTLNYMELLNDTIVDFWLAFIKYEKIPEADRDDVHIFSTFFYKKLIENLEQRHLGGTQRSADQRYNLIKKNYGTKRISKWTRKVDLFSKKYIVIPIVDDAHWYLAIIYNLKGMISTAEEPAEDNHKAKKRGSIGPTSPEALLLMFDSFAEPDPKKNALLDIMRDYFELEFEDKKLEGRLERTRLGIVIPSNLPQQSNFVDCGFYVLKFAEMFLTKPPIAHELRTLDWSKKYWHFDISFYRDIIRETIHALVSRERWERFLAWEEANKFKLTNTTSGVTSEAAQREKYEEACIDRARRPRRYSEFGVKHLEVLSRNVGHHGNILRLRRCKSLPATLEFIDRTFAIAH